MDIIRAILRIDMGFYVETTQRAVLKPSNRTHALWAGCAGNYSCYAVLLLRCCPRGVLLVVFKGLYSMCGASICCCMVGTEGLQGVSSIEALIESLRKSFGGR